MTPLDALVATRLRMDSCGLTTPLHTITGITRHDDATLLRPPWHGILYEHGTAYPYIGLLLENGGLYVIGFMPYQDVNPVFTVIQPFDQNAMGDVYETSKTRLVSGKSVKTTLEVFLSTTMCIIEWHHEGQISALHASVPHHDISAHDRLALRQMMEPYRDHTQPPPLS